MILHSAHREAKQSAKIIDKMYESLMDDYLPDINSAVDDYLTENNLPFNADEYNAVKMALSQEIADGLSLSTLVEGV